MPSYLIQASYTVEALQALIKKPQDRTAVVAKTVENLGGSDGSLVVVRRSGHRGACGATQQHQRGSVGSGYRCWRRVEERQDHAAAHRSQRTIGAEESSIVGIYASYRRLILRAWQSTNPKVFAKQIKHEPGRPILRVFCEGWENAPQSTISSPGRIGRVRGNRPLYAAAPTRASVPAYTASLIALPVRVSGSVFHKISSSV